MLRRIPFWGWFAIILATLYLAYNPSGVSVFHLWASPGHMGLPVRLMLTSLVLVSLGLYAWGSVRALGAAGFLILAALIGLAVWIAATTGLFDPSRVGTWSWAAQPIAAIVLTIGFQWAKIWQSATGRVGVDDPDAAR